MKSQIGSRLVSRPQEVSAQSNHGGLDAELVKQTLQQDRIALVTNFPADAELYVELLSELGEPLPNYESASGGQTASDAKRFINDVLVKDKPSEGGRQFVYENRGPLAPHSSRSWAEVRPNWFAMAMIDPGWTHFEPGMNGESVVLEWREHLRWLSENDPVGFDRDVRLLRETPITFPANNVVEPCSALPLIYPLADASDPLDLGIRLKSDILDRFDRVEVKGVDRESYLDALKRFVGGVANSPRIVSFPLRAGDILILDNNRFAHGRQTFVPRQAPSNPGDQVTNNPRRLWSVSVS